MKVNIRRLRPEAKVPEYGSEMSAGFDLCSCVNWTLNPGQKFIVPTGWAFEFPDGEKKYDEKRCFEGGGYSYHLSIRPRSGLAAKNGVTVLNSPGTVDSDYRGEVGVILINLSNKKFNIKVGDRIAQGVLELHQKITNFCEVEELEETERGNGGFGSTGVEFKNNVNLVRFTLNDT